LNSNPSTAKKKKIKEKKREKGVWGEGKRIFRYIPKKPPGLSAVVRNGKWGVKLPSFPNKELC
jgi:hypothetical protein